MHADFLALSGAAKILAYRPEEGLKDLSTPLLGGQPKEVELWQAVALAEMRDWADAEGKIRDCFENSCWWDIPEPFYPRFSVLSVDGRRRDGQGP